MRIVVWVREIADTRDLVGEVLDPTGRPRWGDWESRVDPEDLNAIEMALQVKDGNPDVKVAAISVGQPRKLDVLRECLYRGVDEALRLKPQAESSGLREEARLVAAAVNRMGAVDAVFAGVQLNEGETAQKAGLLARSLDWPLVSYAEAMEGCKQATVNLRRAIEGGVQEVEVRLPAVISVGVALLKDDPRAPRSAKAKLKLQHKKTPIPEWGGGELSVAESSGPEAVRLLGFRPHPQRSFPSRRVDGSSESELMDMVRELRSKGLMR